ncbi:hypothetical protein VTK73DRAFT_665 [Phialemonium thermophilum]|uniref:Zinc finger PHD-type domain-containing protein n=1 Tax=Phialemonium thermophilum TaxID=223376 RepID=A0ABR3VUK4_9PEZI
MAGFATATGGYGRQDTVSPTAYRQTTSLPTPSTGSRGHGVRCICDRAEIERDGDYGMVQCDSCEMLLHSRCVNLSKTTLPSIYICAFCANTPNARTARSRNHSRLFGEVGPPLPSTSPLAHKSFKFR